VRDATDRKHTKAGLRLLAIHEKLGSADEAELDSALADSPTEGATTVVIETMMVSYQTGGDQSRIEYASTRTASSVG
jgi:hypothetical protein